MDIRELIKTRRTVNAYLPDKVDDALVEEALALSLWAPNHKLTFPWVYTWLGPVTRAKLGELGAELKGGAASVKGQATRASVTTPSHLISLGLRKSADPHRYHEDYATLAGSVQTACLFLWQHGIGTKWTTSGWSMHPRAYEIMGVNPDEVQLEGCLMIGREQMKPRTPERPPLSQFLRKTT